MKIVYQIRRGTRYAARTQREYPVNEIIVDGSVVGAVHDGDGYLFGEVQWSDGTRKALNACLLNVGESVDTMTRLIMGQRTLPPGQEGHVDTGGWTAVRVEYNPEGKVYPHSTSDTPSEVHYGNHVEPSLAWADDARVRRCDGALGRVVGPGSSYGTVVEWDHGGRFWTDAACLSLVGGPV